MSGQYAISRADAEMLMGATGLPLEARLMVLRHHLADRSADAVLDLFAQFIGLANSVVENNREMVEIVLMVEGGMSDRMAEKINLPTIFGALQGIRLADGVDQSALCQGCAFRPGTPANQSPSTTCDADYCAHPGEANFMCHADMDERGEPTRACPGWAQLRAQRKRAAA